MPVTIRMASADDVMTILELWQGAAENRSRPADTQDAVTTLLDRDAAALLVADDDSADGTAVVGTIIVGWDGWRCHLYRLAVDAGHRRKGIGQALVDAAAQRARELGATRIDAMVLDDNDLGRRIWQAAGYTQQEDWRRWVKPLTSPQGGDR